MNTSEVKNKYLRGNIMVNWINGFKAGNKKEKYELNFRLGTFTVLEIKWCPCDEGCTKFRFMILNLGFEI
jgi:hypothetical protein|tara:strand:- start:594 stop:803 length:210 start_codon:yes stop_codon:yes gene_type:complete